MMNKNGMPPMGGMPSKGGMPPMDGMPPMEGSLRFEPGAGGPPPGFVPPMADISWVERKYLDVEYATESPAQKIDIYLPEEGDGPFPLLIHIHGGGFGLGDKRDDHMDVYLKGILKGFAVASVEYRLSGEALFPAAVLDVREAVRFVRANAADYQIDPTRIGVIGGSAGGNLAAMLAMNIPNGEFPGEEGKEICGDCSVKAAVDQFGPTDFAVMDTMARENGVSFVDHDMPFSAESSYLGGPLPELDNAYIQQANPMTYINDGMCPMLIQHGCLDKLVPYKQSVIFVEAIKEKLGEGRVEFDTLETADHEDMQFRADENMDRVWAWLDENIK